MKFFNAISFLLLLAVQCRPYSAQDCCPSESLPLTTSEEYEDKGQVVKEDDLELYVVGNGTRCIIWNYDIAGFDGGRTRELADVIASQGYMVIIPDYYRGPNNTPRSKLREFIVEKTKWEELRKDWEDKILPFAESRGAKTFGAIG